MKITYEQATAVAEAVREYNRLLRSARSDLARKVAEAGVPQLASRFPKHRPIPPPFREDFLQGLARTSS